MKIRKILCGLNLILFALTFFVLTSSALVSSAQGIKVTIDFKDLDFGDVDRSRVSVWGGEKYRIGNSESVTLRVEGLPNYVDIYILKKGLVRRIWIEQNKISLKGGLEDIIIEPNYIYQTKIDENYSEIKVGKKFDSDLSLSRPYLIHLKRNRYSYTAEYIGQVMSNLPDSLQNFWAAEYLNSYLLAFDKVAYDPKEERLSYLKAIDRDKSEQLVKPNGQKYLLLDFSVNGCGYCIAGVDRLVETSKKYSDNLDVVMIWEGFTHEKWLNHSKQYESKIAFPNLLDENGAIFNKFDFKYYPAYLLFNKDGELVKKWGGKLPKDIGKHLK